MDLPVDTTGVYAVLGRCQPAMNDGEQKRDADTGLLRWRANVAVRFPGKQFQAINVGLLGKKNPAEEAGIGENEPVELVGLTFNEVERDGEVIKWYTADEIRAV